MHDKMYSLFVDGEKMLLSAELKNGDKALEVGCGPGFFTIPAAKIVGENGFIYAIDINPFAIKKVNKKLTKARITNVKTMIVDVRETTLESQSIDHVFFFGVIHSLIEIIDETLAEMDRILKPQGTLVVQKSRKAAEEIIRMITEKGKFQLTEEKRRMMIFRKISS